MPVCPPAGATRSLIMRSLRASSSSRRPVPDRDGGPQDHAGPRVLADKAYSTRKIRDALRRRGIKATIPEPSNQVAGRKSRGSGGGRPPKFDKETYKTRNTVERAINRLRGYRAVATRYDKREFVYKGTIDVASIGIWLRQPADQDPRDTP